MREIPVVSALIAALMLFAAAVSAQVPTEPGNMGFEEADAAGTPAVWFVPGAGFSATVEAEGAPEGARCVRLAPAPGGAPGAPFGNIMQAFDATPFRGKRVTFEGWVRCEGPQGASAQLWMRVDRTGERPGFFDNMADRPIHDAEWKKYRIVGDVAPDAKFINIGMLSTHGATAWADGFTFAATGVAGEGNDKPRTISDRGMMNLVALTRLSGYIRFFHPSTESQSVDWDLLMIGAVGAVETAPGPKELAAALGDVFRPIAPSVRVWAGGVDQAPGAVPPPPAATTAIAFRHTGVNFANDPNSVYSSTRVVAALGTEGDSGIPVAGTSVIKDLGGGVCCSVPVSLFAAGDATLPKAEGPGPTLPKKPADWKPNGEDRDTRLAAVMLGWNVIENFYPYFDAVQVDWAAVLPETLRAAAIDPDAKAFCRTLGTMIAKARDGHGGISSLVDDRGAPLDLDWVWVGNDLVVTRAPLAGAATGLLAGDVVQSIDGVPIAECYRQVSATISAATDQFQRYRALYELKVWSRGQATTVIARRGTGDKSRPVVATVTRSTARNLHIDGIVRPMSGAEVRPGIVYFDLVGAGVENLTKAMPRLAAARGIVFDMRGYPADAAVEVLRHLSDQTLSSARWMIPVITLPDREDLKFEQAPSWSLPPLEPRFTTNVAFLTDGEAISYAESIMGIVEHYKLGEIVGGPTAGTNGNVNPIPLPGGYTMMYTGMQVLKQDGSPHHGVGIAPTVPCERTIEGITAGRDEVLEKAIDILQSKLAEPAPR